MTEPRWLTRSMVGAFHADQLGQHLGRAGIRGENLLESALARTRQKWSYGERDPSLLAAAYAFGIARNHPVVDGNERVAFVALATFLRLNGSVLRTSPEDVVTQMIALAAGQRDEEELAAWIRGTVHPHAR
jgi:death-on-curing protein